MRNDIYQKLIEHVSKREWVDANDVFRSILEQKVALRLESEKKLLTEPDEDDDDKDDQDPKETPGRVVNEETYRLECLKCGHKYSSSDPSGYQTKCPKCKSSDWKKLKEEVKEGSLDPDDKIPALQKGDGGEVKECSGTVIKGIK